MKKFIQLAIINEFLSDYDTIVYNLTESDVNPEYILLSFRSFDR